MQRKDFLKYAYMRKEILENNIERSGDLLDTDRLNREDMALDLLLMSCKKEVEEIEEELFLADPSIEESDNTYEDIDNYDSIEESDYEDFLNIPRYLKENKSSDSFLK